jgi:branched-chain amino acid aminotransferase
MIAEPDALARVWMDGEIIAWKDATMHICDHHYGFGVFEGVRAYRSGTRTGLFRLEDHTKRLFQSARLLGLRIPEAFSPTTLNKAQLSVVRENNLGDAYVRPFVFQSGTRCLSPRGQDLQVRVGIMALAWLGGSGYLSESERGIRLKSSSFVRNLQGHLVKAKAHANYMTAMLALQEARQAGADDALLFDAHGNVTEASAANVFLVRDGRLLAPPSHLALEGITRDTIIQLARTLSLDFQEKVMTKDDVYLASEVFLSGSAVGITPVREVDGRTIGTGEPGSVTRALRETYRAVVSGATFENRQWLSWV